MFPIVIHESINEEIRQLIFSFIGNEDSYWKDIFNKHILIHFNYKNYFSKYVLSHIDLGFREVSMYTGPCQDCYYDGYAIPNPECNSCFFYEPCLNCYWYNSDPYNLNTGCYCSANTQLISFKEVSKYSIKLQKFSNYFEFLRSKEWQNYLNQQANDALILFGN